MKFPKQYLDETALIAQMLDINEINKIAEIIKKAKDIGSRLFFLGLGGSAGSSSHSVNDFRKIVGIESYFPGDNISELTARANDDGFDSIFIEWLKESNLNKNDVIFVLSVGGGSLEKNISVALIKAMDYAKNIGCKIIGVAGKDGGYFGKIADAKVIIPVVNQDHITPHSEEYASVITHLLVSHPLLKQNQTKWESKK